MKEPAVAGGKGQVDGDSKVMVGTGRDVKMIFKVKARIGKAPIGKRGVRK